MIYKHSVTVQKIKRNGYTEDFFTLETRELINGKWQKESFSSATGRFAQDVVIMYSHEYDKQNAKNWLAYQQERKITPKGKPVVFYSFFNPFVNPKYIGRGWYNSQGENIK